MSSIVCCPKYSFLTWNTSAKSFYSGLLSVWCNSQCTFTFSLLGRYSTVIMIWLANRFFQICLLICSSWLLKVPSIFTRYERSVFLFIWRWMVIANLLFANVKIAFLLRIFALLLREKPISRLTIFPHWDLTAVCFPILDGSICLNHQMRFLKS